VSKTAEQRGCGAGYLPLGCVAREDEEVQQVVLVPWSSLSHTHAAVALIKQPALHVLRNNSGMSVGASRNHKLPNFTGTQGNFKS